MSDYNLMDPNDESIVYWRKKSFYLNITNRCTNNCVFCVRNYKTAVFGFNLKLTREPTEQEIINELRKYLTNAFEEVVFTGYGEPLERLDAVCNISREIKRLFPEIIVRLDTNGLGQLINPDIDVIMELKLAGINQVSISLNASNAEQYNKICRSKFGKQSFEAIQDFAKAAKYIFKTNYTIVAIPQIDIQACQNIAKEQEIFLKIRQYSGPDLVIE